MKHEGFLIFESITNLVIYLDILNNNLRTSGIIPGDVTWDTPKEVGTEVNRRSKRWWIHKPPEEYFNLAPAFFINEIVDEDPRYKEEETYLIYDFINPDSENKILNYLLPPTSLHFKKDVSKRFPERETFDEFGNLIKIEYFDEISFDINELGIRTVEYGNLVTEATFEYFYGSDGYLNSRTSKRYWYKKDGTK